MEISVRRTYTAQLWLLVGVALMVIAGLELHRVASGRLFLFATAFDGQPSVHEVRDATTSARRWLLPALLSIGCGCAIGYFLNARQINRLQHPDHRTSPIWRVAFLIATACDLFTTLWFFHEVGIDVELHPGVRLLGYAYGRTAGPVIAKIVQATGILWLGERLPRGGNVLLLFTSVVYTLAAAHNIGWL